jgi:hypothetical protein
MSGFFLITRGISKHPLFKRKPDRLAVWVWLLDNAAFKDTTQDAKGKTVPVPRGSVCASLRHIADETGVGHQVVRTALKRFETEHMVNTKVTHGKTVISLCNYEKHQRSGVGDNTAPNTSLTQDQHKPNTQKKQGNKETREETNVSCEIAPPAIDEIAQGIQHFNALAPASNWPMVQKVTPPRRSALRGRIKDCGGLDAWCEAMTRASRSQHLTGNNNRGWTATFDWLANHANFTKLMEGNYDDRNNSQQPNQQQRPDPALEQIARLAGLGTTSGNGGF